MGEHLLVKIFGQRRRRHQQLGVGGTHDGGQNGGQQNTGHHRVEHRVDQHHEDGFRIGQFTAHVFLHIEQTDQSDHQGTGHGQEAPGDGDTAGGGDVLVGAGGIEAGQNMRLAEVAQAPGGQRDDGDNGQRLAIDVLPQGQQVGVQVLQVGFQLAEAAFHCCNRHYHQRRRHHQTLYQIGPGYRQKAAEHGVGHDAEGTDYHGNLVIQTEHGFKQLAAGNQARAGVEQEEQQYHQGRDNLQYLGFVFKAARQVLGNGDGVIYFQGVGAQSFGAEHPVGPGTQQQAAGQPE